MKQRILTISKFAVSGFTLAELLIALGILAVIATFTIPKLLQSQQDSKYSAETKEMMSMIAQAYEQYVNDHGYSTTISMADLTPYMNYVSLDTTNSIDDIYGRGVSNSCVGSYCLVFHNGGKLNIQSIGYQFGGSSSTNMIQANFDPDGRVTDGTTDGPGKSIGIYLFYNGRVSTRGGLKGVQTCGSWACPINNVYDDPPWFSWN